MTVPATRTRATSGRPLLPAGAGGVTLDVITPEQGTPGDDAALCRLLAETPMGGAVRLTFAREPSYLEAAAIQGHTVQVLVARDGPRIVGAGSRALRSAWVNGEPVTAGHLSDLRLHPDYRGGSLLHRGYRELRRLHGDRRAAIYTTVIVEDNVQALQTLAANRAGLPEYTDLGRVLTPMIAVRRRRRSPCDPVTRGTAALLPRILAVLNRNRLQFAPRYGPGDLGPGGRLRDLAPEDFLVLWRGEAIAGVLAVWDQRRFRQTTVDGYGGVLGRVRPLLNLLRQNLLRRPPLPAPGSTLPFGYVALVSTVDVAAFRVLLRHAVDAGAERGLDYLVVGLHERDPRAAVLREHPRTRFAGRLFAVTFDGPADLDGRVPYVEAALL